MSAKGNEGSELGDVLSLRSSVRDSPVGLLQNLDLFETPIQVVSLLVPRVSFPVNLRRVIANRTSSASSSRRGVSFFSLLVPALFFSLTCSSAHGSLKRTAPVSGVMFAKA